MTQNILLSTAHVPWPFLRQTENGHGKWQNAHFRFNTDQANDCDFLGVYDEPHQAITTTIPWENRILFLGEPPSIRSYPLKYLNQFGIVVCPYDIGKIKGRQVKTHTSLPWHFGVTRSTTNSQFMDFKFLLSMPLPEKKPGISVVCSNKAITPEHVQRLQFLEKLKQAIGEKLHIFGRGFQEIDDKADAVIPYEFHLVLENNAVPHFWTEKTADAFLGYSYPLFSGCPNIHEYFPAESMTCIDIKDTDKAIQTIKEILETPNFYQNHLEQIKTVRKKILTEYNMFSVMHDLFTHSIAQKGFKQTIYPSAHFESKNKSYMKALTLIYKVLKKSLTLVKNPSLIKTIPSRLGKLHIQGKPVEVILYFKKKYKNPFFFLDMNDSFGKYSNTKGYFGQRGQDMYLDQHIFKMKNNGVFVDIGANHPKKLSNTYFFEKNRNWSGIAFEPQSRFQEMWKEQRKTLCLPYLLGDNDNDSVPFLEVNTEEWQNALSGIDGYIERNVSALDGRDIDKKMLKMHRLDTVLKQQGIKKVDFITIDVEGFELNVLKGINLQEFGVEALIVENDRTILGDDEIRDYICNQGYRHVARLSGDDIFKRIA